MNDSTNTRKPGQGRRVCLRSVAPALVMALALSLFSIPSSEGDTLPERFRPLVDDSPFLTAAFRARMDEEVRPRGNLAFHGFATLGGETFFSILNKSDNRGYLLAEGQEQDEIKVVSFDKEADELIVYFRGNEITLGLEAPR